MRLTKMRLVDIISRVVSVPLGVSGGVLVGLGEMTGYVVLGVFIIIRTTQAAIFWYNIDEAERHTRRRLQSSK